MNLNDLVDIIFVYEIHEILFTHIKDLTVLNILTNVVKNNNIYIINI